MCSLPFLVRTENTSNVCPVENTCFFWLLWSKKRDTLHQATQRRSTQTGCEDVTFHNKKESSSHQPVSTDHVEGVSNQFQMFLRFKFKKINDHNLKYLHQYFYTCWLHLRKRVSERRVLAVRTFIMTAKRGSDLWLFSALLAVDQRVSGLLKPCTVPEWSQPARQSVSEPVNQPARPASPRTLLRLDIFALTFLILSSPHPASRLHHTKPAENLWIFGFYPFWWSCNSNSMNRNG